MPPKSDMNTRPAEVAWMNALHLSDADPTQDEKDHLGVLRRSESNRSVLAVIDALLARPTG